MAGWRRLWPTKPGSLAVPAGILTPRRSTTLSALRRSARARRPPHAGVWPEPGDAAQSNGQNYRRAIAVNVDQSCSASARPYEPNVVPSPTLGSEPFFATSSLAGIDPLLPNPVYVLSKHVVVGFMRVFVPELAAEGIAALVICPGLTDTGRPPRDRKEVIERLGARVATWPGCPTPCSLLSPRPSTQPVPAGSSTRTRTYRTGHSRRSPACNTGPAQRAQLRGSTWVYRPQSDGGCRHATGGH
jgi:NAD(P)-dependent dehydrogenase (short-subunit alcohol dehydrogenase family)